MKIHYRYIHLALRYSQHFLIVLAACSAAKMNARAGRGGGGILQGYVSL